jgi:Ca2+-binding RTX toxin-like protein
MSMYDTTCEAVDAAPSAWLDAGSTDTPGTLHGGKANPPPPPPPPIDPSIINGTNGDDMLQGGTGTNTIYGGKGEDTVVYRGALGDYELIYEDWQFKMVDKVSGRDGSDLLNGVERLQFDGITVLLGSDGSAHLEDGTELLAPYVPPPLPDGWDDYIGIWPVEGGGDIVIAIDAVTTTDIGLAGVSSVDSAFIVTDA